MSDEYILELKDIVKEFSGVKALDGINIRIRKGEIHAVVGENGAGKSTMMKIISGVYPYGTYSGTMTFLGEERHFGDVHESEKAGIAIIYQENSLVRNMNIAENVYLGNEITRNGIISWDSIIAKTKEYLKQVDLDINPMTQVLNLGIGQQQLVEIAKAISKEAKLLILDEPTAALTETESENLLGIMRRLNEQGVTCVFISHKLDEVYQIADTISVIRDGQSICTCPAAELSQDQLISRMVGRDMTELYPARKHNIGDTILSVKNWTLKDPLLPSRKLVDNVNFELKRGEILGVSGLMGAGRTELAMSIFGCYKGFVSGEIELEGKKLDIKSPADAIRCGIAYVSEDRKKYGFNRLMDIEDNITLAALDKLVKGRVIDQSKKISYAQKFSKDLRVKATSVKQMVVNLSGGNQQKVILGKWIMTEPSILILDEPTRGIDIGAKYEIYSLMNELAEKGMSIMMISSELPEILGMSDRVLVMHEGKMSGVLDNRDLTQEIVMSYAIGGNER